MAKPETIVSEQPTERSGEITYNTPSNNWFTVRDWHQLGRGAKREVLAAIKGDSAFTQGYDITNGILAVLITNWSYKLPLPKVAIGSLDIVPPEDDAVFTEAAAPARRVLFPATPSTPEEQARQEADPTSPTAPASE